MSRILVLSPYEPPADGIAKHTSHLVDAWDAAGHRVLVIAPGKARGPVGAESISSRSNVARIIRRIPNRHARGEIAKFEPDIVFVQFAISSLTVHLWWVRSLCRHFHAAHVPMVVAYHETAREYDRLKFVSRQIYKSIARVTTVPIAFSSAGREALLESGLFNEVVEVPHGVRIFAIADDDVRRVKTLYNIHKPLVLTLGFTISDKGTDVLLDAASEIAVRRGNDVQFLIAGSPRRRRGVFRFFELQDVRYQRQLENQAEGLANVDVAFCSFVADEDVAALLFVADVVALPYRRTSQSGVANLAISSRAVVVCSDLPGLRSNLGSAAKYVAVGDAGALAKEIVSLLGDDNESIRSQMRELSEERASANTYERVAAEVLSAGLAHRAANTPT